MKKLVRRGLNLVSSRTAILLYHRIADVAQDPWSLAVHPQNFAEQLEALRKINVVRLSDAEPCRLRPSRPDSLVAITFDDGYLDNYTEALPLLARFETPATFFIATRPVRKHLPFWWDELQSILFHARRTEQTRLTLGAEEILIPSRFEETAEDTLRRLHPWIQQFDIPERWKALDQLRDVLGTTPAPKTDEYAMTEDQLQQMSTHPLVEIGAHTVTHPKLSALSPERQLEEIQSSRAYLETLIGKEVTSFAYPYGASLHFTSTTEQLVRAAGFQRACTTEPAVFRKQHGNFRIPRLNVPNVDGERFSRWLRSYLD